MADVYENDDSNDDRKPRRESENRPGRKPSGNPGRGSGSRPDRKPSGAPGRKPSGTPGRKPAGKPGARARDGERREKREYRPRDGERREKREYRPRERDNHRERAYGRGGTRGDGRSDRGGVGREFTEAERLAHELRPVRSRHDDPEIPETVTANQLNPGARNELKTLDKDLADRVARHLAMVALLLDDNPELAHQHAISASRKAGRIPVVRETLAITSYVLGDFAAALRELRTYRRLSGRDDQLAMMIDCERGLGRPEKALELGRSANISALPDDVQVQVAIAMSGARLDLGDPKLALLELEIAQLNPKRAFDYSPELFACYANVLEDLDRPEEAAKWRKLAETAEEALREKFEQEDTIVVVEETVKPWRDADADAAAGGTEDPENAEDAEDER